MKIMDLENNSNISSSSTYLLKHIICAINQIRSLCYSVHDFRPMRSYNFPMPFNWGEFPFNWNQIEQKRTVVFPSFFETIKMQLFHTHFGRSCWLSCSYLARCGYNVWCEMKCETHFFCFTVNALFRLIPIANGTESTSADNRKTAHGKWRDAWEKMKHKKMTTHQYIWNANANIIILLQYADDAEQTRIPCKRN